MRQMCEAVKTMSEVANGNYPASQVVYEGIGELAAAIDDFDASIVSKKFLLNILSQCFSTLSPSNISRDDLLSHQI